MDESGTQFVLHELLQRQIWIIFLSPIIRATLFESNKFIDENLINLLMFRLNPLNFFLLRTPDKEINCNINMYECFGKILF